MALFNVGDEVEVIATEEVGTVEAVTKNFWRQLRYKLVGGDALYKESELRRVTQPVVFGSYASDTETDTTPDTVTQVVLANMYMNQMQDIVDTVQEQNSTIPDSVPEVAKAEVVENKPSIFDSSWYTDRQKSWDTPAQSESKSVDVDVSPSHSVPVDDSSSSWSSRSSDDSSSYSSPVDNSSSYSSRDDSSYSSSSSSYDSGSSYDSSPSSDSW